MSEEVEWLTRAMLSAFGKDSNEGAPVKVAWPTDLQSARNKQSIRNWAEQLQIMRKREALANIDILQSSIEAIKSKELTEDSKRSEKSLLDLRKQIWADLDIVKTSVCTVKQQISRAAPGKSDHVQELAAAIDLADAALGDFKRRQASAFRLLVEQEESLEEELAAVCSGNLASVDTHHVGGLTQAPRATKGHAIAARANAPVKQAWAEEAQGRGESSEETDDSDMEDDTRPAADNSAYLARRRVSTGAAGGHQICGRGSGCLAPEVAEFDSFVLKHGDCGGWDREDHDEFVRIVKACAGDYTKAVAVCMERVIGFSRSEVMDHARWHMDYMDLMVRKRVALAKWREGRERQRSKVRAQAALLDSETAKQAEEEQRCQSHMTVTGKNEHQVRKVMVQQWREQQEELRRAREAEAAEVRQRAEERRKIILEERQLVNKMKLDLHKQVKERVYHQARLKAELLAEQKASEEADPVQAWRVSERNNELLRRKQMLLASKEEKRRRREVTQAKLLDKVCIEVDPDPHRVLKGTSAHMQRVQARRDEAIEPKQSGFVLKINTRVAVPTWRAGL